jgi:PHP family Zn ribbon phosphoesterase
MAMNTKERAEIWNEYFEKLLNTEEPKELLKIGNREFNGADVEELTIEDVKKAMINLKNKKAAGTDGIRPELKYRGNELLNRIY